MTTGSVRKCLIAAAVLAAPALAHAQAARGNLEGPPPGAVMSGIGFIFGWHCSAERIELVIDGGEPLRAAQGTLRPDTAEVCGHVNAGFGVTVNWARFAPGTHTIRALADGVEFASRTFAVATYGMEFLTGKAATVTVNDFPAKGSSSVLEWREGTQSFALRERQFDNWDAGGDWGITHLERRTECRNAGNDGDHTTWGLLTLDVRDTSIVMTERTTSQLTCNYNGDLQWQDNVRRTSGTFTCSDGRRGTFTSNGFAVTRYTLSLDLDIRLDTSESCRIAARLVGGRL